jgi:hypothetical protein
VSQPLRTRREAITACIALLGVAGIAPVVTRVGSSFADRLLQALQLDASKLNALCSARARAQLAEHLSASGVQVARIESSEQALLSTLRRFVAEDYANGDIVDVDGWQLASTEALMIAVLAARV